MSRLDESVAEKPLISRRKLVGTAVWGAPAIVVATAAPALATSARTVTLGSTVTATWSSTTATIAPFNLTVTNAGGATTHAMATFAFASSFGAITLPTTPSGWQAVVGGSNVAGGSTVSAPASVTYEYLTATAGSSSGATVVVPQLAFTFASDPQGLAQSDGVTVTPGGDNTYTSGTGQAVAPGRTITYAKGPAPTRSGKKNNPITFDFTLSAADSAQSSTVITATIKFDAAFKNITAPGSIPGWNAGPFTQYSTSTGVGAKAVYTRTVSGSSAGTTVYFNSNDSVTGASVSFSQAASPTAFTNTVTVDITSTNLYVNPPQAKATNV